MVGSPDTGSPGGYLPFSRSPIWLLAAASQRALLSAMPSESTGLPAACAAVAIAFWRDLRRERGSVGETFHVFDLDAGSGGFALRFLDEFFGQFDALRDTQERACLVMCGSSATQVAAWQRDERLLSHARQGRLDFAVFDPGQDGDFPLEIRKQVLSTDSLRSPPVFVARHLFAKLPQDLFHLDRRLIREAYVSLEEDMGPVAPGEACLLKTSYELRPVTRDATEARLSLLCRYAEQSRLGYLAFPSGALGLIQRLRRLHEGECLLLAADRGAVEAAPLVGTEPPEVFWRDGLSFPVHYGAIADTIDQCQGTCWRYSGAGVASLVAAMPPRSSPTPARPSAAGESRQWREMAFAAGRYFASALPNGLAEVSASLIAHGDDLTPAQAMAGLHLAGFHGTVCRSLFPVLRQRLGGEDGPRQAEWSSVLEAMWAARDPIANACEFAFDIALLAAELNRWRQASAFLQRSLKASDSRRARIRIRYNLAIVHWQLAASDEAEFHLRAAQDEIANAIPGHDDLSDEDSDKQLVEDGWVALASWRSECEALLGASTLPAAPSIEARGHLAYLTLMGEQHAQAVYRLQRSPSLAESAAVDAPRSSSEARDWILDRQADGETLLSLVQREDGLVGLVSLSSPQETARPAEDRCARFYYWVGEPFQGRGYGARAIELLVQLAGRNGVRHLFALVERDNAASRRTLEGAGFVRLPLEMADAVGTKRYHYLGPAQMLAQQQALLVELLQELEGEIDPDLDSNDLEDAPC